MSSPFLICLFVKNTVNFSASVCLLCISSLQGSVARNKMAICCFSKKQGRNGNKMENGVFHLYGSEMPELSKDVSGQFLGQETHVSAKKQPFSTFLLRLLGVYLSMTFFNNQSQNNCWAQGAHTHILGLCSCIGLTIGCFYHALWDNTSQPLTLRPPYKIWSVFLVTRTSPICHRGVDCIILSKSTCYYGQ